MLGVSKPSQRPVVVGVVVVALALGTAGSSAATTEDLKGKACVSRDDDAVRYVARKSTPCRRGERSVAWTGTAGKSGARGAAGADGTDGQAGDRGPAGPRGETGAAGSPGPAGGPGAAGGAGTAGADGADGVHGITDLEVVTAVLGPSGGPTSGAQSDASCPAGKSVVGGGFSLPDDVRNVILSRPGFSGGWQALETGPMGTGRNATFTTYALCATVN